MRACPISLTLSSINWAITDFDSQILLPLLHIRIIFSMTGLEYIDEVHDFFQGITLGDKLLLFATPLATPSLFEDSTVQPEDQFTELLPDVDNKNPDIPIEPETVPWQTPWSTTGDVFVLNTNSIAKR